MIIRDLGLIDFTDALALQERLAAGVADGTEPETLLLLEHPPVYTIGSGGNLGNVLDPAIEVIRTSRGGDVTWHGPGQLVGYPIVDLGRRGRDLHRWLRFLEEVLIRVTAAYGVSARRVPGKTGVWTDSGKIAAIGVGVRRWVTMHGCALNVTPDLAAFTAINPCGFPACPVTSLARESGQWIEMAEVKSRTAATFLALLDSRLPLAAVPPQNAFPLTRKGGLRPCPQMI
jgi:lipoyl(octanoyl) transferase